MKKNTSTFFKAVIFIIFCVFLVWFAPRPSSEVCVSDIDCGSDVGGTDINTIHSYGYPLSVRTITTRREYKPNYSGSIESSTLTINYNYLGINVFIIFSISYLAWNGIGRMKTKTKK